MSTIPNDERKEFFDPRRRALLFWIPSAIFTAITATLAATAFRFLRPRADTHAALGQAGNWTPLVNATTLSGDQPTLHKLSFEKVAGWSIERQERAVFVLSEGLVLSAICPHEQCEVAWSAEAAEFLCPCHDSRFSSEGKVLSGPATRDLDAIPTRVENGVLQVRLEA